MVYQVKRPQLKTAPASAAEEERVFFSLGPDAAPFVPAAEREDYRSDPRARALIRDIQAGKDLFGREFDGVNLKNADISGGKLRGASFKNALFFNTQARSCDLGEADFSEAYLEASDLTDTELRGALWTRAYLRRLKWTQALTDAPAQSRLEAMERLIAAIESGKVDLRSISPADLMCLDLRRLDLTHVDLTGIDLSCFNLEGVNLRGTHVNPLRLMSLEGLQRYHLFVQRLNEKKLKTAVLEVLKKMKKELAAFEERMLKTRAERNEAPLPEWEGKRARPAYKYDEFKTAAAPSLEAQETAEEEGASEEGNAPVRLKTQARKMKKTKNKLRS